MSIKHVGILNRGLYIEYTTSNSFYTRFYRYDKINSVKCRLDEKGILLYVY